MLFNLDQLFEDYMGIRGSKALRNTENSRSEALVSAKKADNALRTYAFEDISPALVLKINPRAKRMALRLDPKKRVVNLVLPKRASMVGAYKFALEHKYWIREKLAELPEQIGFEDGAVISILGKLCEIKVSYDKTLKKTDIYLKNNELIVSTNKEDPSSRIKRFIINLAKDHLHELAHEKAAEIGKTISKIEVKDTTSRWGSCSHDGKLCFSWRLIFAPEKAFDYVVAHEVAHLKHMDHSPAFWRLCEDLCEDYSKGKSWMRRHSGELIRYS
ncbi:MAG TPA: SprT family zinc-dependent metalloprotease [Alphaproteobacteria bacterium]|nr:SprT family zinc-dependent metalloprotease [Alphaproteobacteria bacterium]